jgi:predicted nicotinamide N-methyase
MNAPDRVILVVIFDHVNENSDDTIKIRIRDRDLPQAANATVSGAQLHSLLLKYCQDSASNATIDIYNQETESFQLLDHNENDVAKRFGRCIRCTLTCSDPSVNEPRDAIMGRYFAYDADAGLEIAGTTIHVQETPNIPEVGTGLNVWDGAILLAKHLELSPELVKGKRVLELGAGCGLVGIAAGVLGAKEVVLTDLPYCLPLMKKNVNFHQEMVAKSGCQQMKCAVCDWYDPPSLVDLGGDVDVILVADCIWIQELVLPLLNTLKKLAAKGNVQVIISYQQRGKAAHLEFWNGIHSIFSVRGVDKADTGSRKPDCLHLLECHSSCR